MTENTRIKLIDIAKGGGIIGVVFAHAAGNIFSTNTGGTNPLIQFFYSFLYMFFFISGYLYKPGRTPKENIIRMSKRFIPVFILCAVVLTLIMWGYLSLLGYNIPAEDVIDAIIKSLIGKKTFTAMDSTEVVIYGGLCDVSFAFYYIVFLYFASIIFYLIVDKVSDSLKNTAITVAILLVCEFIILSILPVHMPYCIEGCLVPAALMFIGAYASRTDVLKKIETEFLNRKRLVLLLLMLIIGVLSSIFIPLTVGLSSARFGTYGAWSVFTCLIAILSCGYVIFTLFAVLERIPVLSEILAYCGKHSLSILMLHAFYLKILAAPFYTIPEAAVIAPFTTMPEAILASIVSIILCLLTAFVLNKIIRTIKEKRSIGTMNEC